MLLAAITFSVSIVLAVPGSARLFAQPDSPRSQLPATQPGLSRNEGVFLITAADDGGRLVYFIAQNTRHSTLLADLQIERQLNPLWPVGLATREELLTFPEAAPVGQARAGLLTDAVVPVVGEEAPAADVSASGDATTYTVKPGDSAIRIARQFGVDLDALLAANRVANRNRVYVGQVLEIPGAG